MQTKLFTVA